MHTYIYIYKHIYTYIYLHVYIYLYIQTARKAELLPGAAVFATIPARASDAQTLTPVTAATMSNGGGLFESTTKVPCIIDRLGVCVGERAQGRMRLCMRLFVHGRGWI